MAQYELSIEDQKLIDDLIEHAHNLVDDQKELTSMKLRITEIQKDLLKTAKFMLEHARSITDRYKLEDVENGLLSISSREW
jgi:hypothetical protein